MCVLKSVDLSAEAITCKHMNKPSGLAVSGETVTPKPSGFQVSGLRFLLEGPPNGPLRALRVLRVLRLLTPSGILAILCGSGDHSENGGSPLPCRLATFSEDCRHSHAESKLLLKNQNLRFCERVATFCKTSDASAREW